MPLGATEGACTACHGDCATCNASNDNSRCLTCAAGKHLNKINESDAFGTCITCHADCSTGATVNDGCIEATVATACRGCVATKGLPVGTTNAGTCEACHATCLNCKYGGNENYCTSCTAPKTLQTEEG